MRTVREMEAVAHLLESGCNAVEASRASGVPWRTIQKWRQAGIAELIAARRRRPQCDESGCGLIDDAPPRSYAYLLGQYLGDGCIAAFPREVFRLQVYSDLRYPSLIDEVAKAMGEVIPTSKVWIGSKTGCAITSAYSKHWPCLFPQHGAGPKHERPIALESWQERIVESEPRLFLRGLIHSDGCRVINMVKGHPYPRYHFTNRSDDIRALFVWACGLVGVECRPNNRWNISVARRASVELMDTFIGPKT